MPAVSKAKKGRTRSRAKRPVGIGGPADRRRGGERRIRFRAPEEGSQRAIWKQVTVPASVASVWDAWTTEVGVRAFLSPAARIQLQIGGAYEAYFNLEMARGLRGGEGLQILSYLPRTMLSFTWNAPPEFPLVRGQHSWVVVQLDPIGGEQTRVTLTHLGWGTGNEWDRTFEYFQRAWDVVLFRLQLRFVLGPIDWRAPERPPVGWTASIPPP